MFLATNRLRRFAALAPGTTIGCGLTGFDEAWDADLLSLLRGEKEFEVGTL